MRAGIPGKDRWFSILLLLPVVLFYAAHIIGAYTHDLVPTGFAQYDQPYYMANARQFVDGASNGICYGSPFSTSPAPPNIYFQPQFTVLGWLWRITGIDPGVLFVCFGLVFGILCVRACLRVLDHFMPDAGPGRRLVAVLFIWGGGIFFILGSGYGLLTGKDIGTIWLNAFRFDPASGWWFMNVGRNLVYPLEAYYHFLFFGAVDAVLQRRHLVALVLIALLTFSHPFTAVGALLMFALWSTYEVFVARKDGSSRAFLVGVVSIGLGAAMYYGIYLPRDPEHRILIAQWSQPWKVESTAVLGAYALVAGSALIAIWNSQTVRGLFSSPARRLLLVQALVWFALENHELIMKPVQPVHFARGSTWSALFLLAAPFIQSFIRSWTSARRAKRWAIVTLCALFLCDNSTWFAQRITENLGTQGEGVWLTKDQHRLFQKLNKELPPNELLVCNDEFTAYLALTYASHRAFSSHRYNTPWVDKRNATLRDYFSGRITDPMLQQHHIAIVNQRQKDLLLPAGGMLLFTCGDYAVYRMEPAGPR